MKRAARQADVVVPVIAGPTIEQDGQWTKNIVRDEWSTKISSVIVTKLDLVRNKVTLHRHFPVIANKCDILVRNGCILLCDTLEGIAAMRLQILLDEIEHKYANDRTPLTEAEVNKRWKKDNAILITKIFDKPKPESKPESNPLHRVSLCNYWS